MINSFPQHSRIWKNRCQDLSYDFWPNPSQQGVKKTFSHLFSYPYPNISRKAFIKKVSFEIDIYDYMIYEAKAQLRIAVLSVLYTLKFKMF